MSGISGVFMDFVSAWTFSGAAVPLLKNKKDPDPLVNTVCMTFLDEPVCCTLASIYKGLHSYHACILAVFQKT